MGNDKDKGLTRDDLLMVAKNLVEQGRRESRFSVEHGAPVGTGHLYRAPDVDAKMCGVSLTAKFCVIGVLGDNTYRCVPFVIDGVAEDGDILIPVEESPYGYGSLGAIVLQMGMTFVMTPEAIARCRVSARLLAMDEIMPLNMLLARRNNPGVLAWERLAEQLGRVTTKGDN